MPLFRITRKLATALRVKLPKEPVASLNPEYDWFADLFYVERKKCVIWVHRTTLSGVWSCRWTVPTATTR